MARQDAAAATERVVAFIESIDAEVRATGPAGWVIALSSADLPLHVGVSIRGAMLRAEAAVLPGGVIDPHQLLFWNTQAPFVCFGENGDGEVCVIGELPLEGLSTEMLDRLLGLLLASATRAREFAISHT